MFFSSQSGILCVMTIAKPSHNTVESRRITAFVAVMVLVFLIFTFRLFQYQILQGNQYRAEALENRTTSINIPAPRGNIYDRNGLILATNIASFNVVITPANLPEDPGSAQEVFRQLSQMIGVPINLGEISPETPFSPCVSEHGITQIVLYGETTAPYRPVQVACDIDREMAMIIQQKSVDWPGVGIEVNRIREYPTGEVTSTIIGFLGPIPANRQADFEARGFVTDRDRVGYAGLEFTYQDLLAGSNGIRTIERDSAGQELRVLEFTPEQPGLNLRLTIDMRLQAAMDAILRRELAGWNNFLGRILSLNAVAIAINPKTGEILGLVSLPTYENNRFVRGVSLYYYEQLMSDLARPFLNHAITAEHPPGSVFKLVTAVGGLNENVIAVDQELDAPGSIFLEQKFFAADFGREPQEFVDWNRAGFGQIAFVDAIANSSNVYFYKVAGGFGTEVPEGLGICRLQAYAEALGYGQVLGIELPGESDGLLPDPRWKRVTQGENWSTGDTYIAGVGQGYVLVTPLQVLMSAATIANDGKLMKPTIIREVVDGEGNVVQPFVPTMIHDLTTDAVVKEYVQYVAGSGGCQPTGGYKTVRPEVIESVQQGMRQAVVVGTLKDQFANFAIAAAGKTGTAEYCDPFAQEKNLCSYGNWPTHAWTLGYAPYEDPEVAVVVFVYNGNEGASVAGPIVRSILDAYFEIKNLDQ